MRHWLLTHLLCWLMRHDDGLIASVDDDGVVWVPADPEQLLKVRNGNLR